MNTKGLERDIKKIIATTSGYGPEFLPVLKQTKTVLKKINNGRTTAENFFNLGELCLKLEDSGLALEAFKTGYQLNPNHVNCGTYYALLLEQFGRLEESLNVYIELNKTDPDNIHIVERMLLIFYAQNDTKQVLSICQYFLNKGLKYHIIYRYIAQVFYDIGNTSRAVKYMETASVLDGGNDQEYINILVRFYYKNGDFEKVIKCEDVIFSNKSSTLNIKLIYATSLAELGKITEARKLFCSLYLQEDDKLSVLTQIALFHLNYENNLVKSNFINQYILNRDPLNIVALTNLSIHESDEFALNSYKKVYEIDPENIQLRYNYGLNLINISGDFEKGYELYESRVPFKMKFLSNVLSYPESLKNKKVFIWCEQGVGDHIWLAWFFQFLAKLNTITKIQVDVRLLPLMNRSYPSLEFTGKSYNEVLVSENIEDIYDHEILLYSLGKYFINDIKDSQKDRDNGVNRPPYLLPDKHRVAYWQQRLKDITGKQIVGICWRSGKQDALRNRNYMSIDEIIQIFYDIDCYVVNLQYDYTDDELNKLSQVLGNRFIHFSELDLKNDFDDLSALMKSIDLVYTACTAVHALSGAIGVNALCFRYFGKNSHIHIFGKSYNFAYPNLKYIGSQNKSFQESLGMFTEEIIDNLGSLNS